MAAPAWDATAIDGDIWYASVYNGAVAAIKLRAGLSKTLALTSGSAIVTDADAAIWNTHFLPNGFAYISGDFANGATNKLYFTFDLPEWDNGTISFNVIWMAPTAGSGTVIFNIAGVRIADSADMNVALAALGSTPSDSFAAPYYRQITPALSSITMAGSGYGFSVSVQRGTDTFADPVHCLGLLVNYTKTAV